MSVNRSFHFTDWFLDQSQWKEIQIHFQGEHDKGFIFKLCGKDRGLLGALFSDCAEKEAITLDRKRFALIDTSHEIRNPGDVCPLYNNDPRLLLRIKSILISIFSPVYALSIIVTRIVTLILLNPIYFLMVKPIREKLDGKQVSYLSCVSLFLNHSLKTLIQVVKDPFFAIGYFFAALYTFFDPYNGRKLLTELEVRWSGYDNWVDFEKDEVVKNAIKNCGTMGGEKFSFEKGIHHLLPICFIPVGYAKTIPDPENLGRRKWVVCKADGQVIENRTMEYMKDAPWIYAPFTCCQNRPDLLNQTA